MSPVALGLSYRCICGKKYKIYMPKRKLFSDLVSRMVDWQAIDAREEADGEVEEVERLAAMSRCHFVDGRMIEHLTCPDCAAEIDLTQHFRTRLLRV